MRCTYSLNNWSAAMLAGLLLTTGAGCRPDNGNEILPPPNQAPIITDVVIESQVRPSTESPVVCMATDPEGDNLTYTWSASGGVIKGKGNKVTWLAPEYPGNYLLLVRIDDGNGGTFSESENITVVADTKPVATLKIRTIIITPPNGNRVVIDPFVIKQQVADNNTMVSARIWETLGIECISEDQDGHKLSYIWSASGGKIKGQGNKVGWTVPGLGGKYSVTITVNCSQCESATAIIDSNVKCCGG
jgi:hypothetical protein